MLLLFFFFFNDTATTEIYTLSLHDALPILISIYPKSFVETFLHLFIYPDTRVGEVSIADHKIYMLLLDRKSTRLNSSHANISYAVFCLKKKKKSFNVPRYNSKQRLGNGQYQ